MVSAAICSVACNSHTVYVVVATVVVMAFISASCFMPAVVAVVMSVVYVIEIKRNMCTYMPCAVTPVNVNAHRRSYIQKQRHRSSELCEYCAFHIKREVRNFFYCLNLAVM